MIIEKNDKKYVILESKNGWRITTEQGKVEVEYKLNKTDAPTIADVERFVGEVSE
jgi:hypothetical protein